MDAKYHKVNSETKKNVYELLLSIFPEESIKEDFAINQSSRWDYAIELNNKVVYVIDVKTGFYTQNTLFNIVRHNFHLDVRGIIFTDGDIAWVSRRRIGAHFYQFPQKEEDAKKWLREEFKQYKKDLRGIKTTIKHTLQSNLFKFIDTEQEKDLSKKGKSKKIKQFVNQLMAKDIQTDGSCYYFTEEKEQALFDILLEKYSKEYITRFIPAKSLYTLIEYRTQNMCSLLCMNDPTEKEYADNWVGRLAERQDAVTTYIISGCEDGAEKDLTMWRLYADDTKGACLRYKIDQSKTRQNGFYFAKVNYGASKKEHFELDILKYIFNLGKNSGYWNFTINSWNIWKHFFKAHYYAAEKEVRLVYIPSKISGKIIHKEDRWFVDDRTGVYSEMKVFDFNKKFPLSLDAAFLGTKFVAREENVLQVKLSFDTRNFKKADGSGIDVELSEINEYR